MYTHPFEKKVSHSIPAALLGTLGLSLALSGCNLPEYRLFMNQVPSTAKSLSLAVYRPDAVSPLVMDDSLQIQLGEAKDVISATVNLPDDAQQAGKTAFAVVARDAQNCILASGTSEAIEPSKTVADVYLSLRPLIVPPPATATCPSSGPTIAEVERFEQGLFGISEFYVKLKGWGFRPTDQINIYSSMEIYPDSCFSDTCKNRCTLLTSCPGLNGPCYTNCRVLQERTKNLSPIETNVYITREDLNSGNPLKGRLITPEPISALLNSPLTIELRRQEGSPPTTFVEWDPPPL